MALRKAIPVHYSAVGVSDTYDQTDIGSGAMAKLANLIPDPTTKNAFICRPAAVQAVNHASQPISAQLVVGTRVYGMRASLTFAGKDEPFCYDLLTGLDIAISGTTSADLPATQSTTGDWTPPTMALIGTYVTVTHPGFNFAAGFAVGWINTLVPSALAWTAGTTATNALPSLPVAAAQFGQRAYFICNPVGVTPSLFATDVLDPKTASTPYILTFGDNVALTALAGLPLNNQLGGIIQSLIVFKGASNMYQVTGDPAPGSAAGPWTINTLNVATGTVSPRSLASTPQGLAFISPDGLRVISFAAQVSDPIGDAGLGLELPFLSPLNPTRLAAAATARVYRASVQNLNKPGTPYEEYWFDIARKVWTGPHSFPWLSLSPYGNTFVGVPVASPTGVWQSDVVQNPTSSFIENGAQLQWSWKTAALPDTKQMSENAVIETTIDFAYDVAASAAAGINMLVTDTVGNTIGAYTIPATGAPSAWGGFVWGSAPWSGAQASFSPVPLLWDAPVVFRRIDFELTGSSSPGVKIGDMYVRYQPLGYLQQ